MEQFAWLICFSSNMGWDELGMVRVNLNPIEVKVQIMEEAYQSECYALYPMKISA
jgi:hypothetical protein